MKFVKVFLATCLYLAQCQSLVTDKILPKPQNFNFHVVNWIKDFNEKHSGTNQIVVLDIGRKSDLLENMLRNVPEGNSVVTVEPTKCNEIETRKAEFVVIFSDVSEVVSEK